MKYISDDKRVITLPVPLGSTLYMVGTEWQQKRFDEIYSPMKEPQSGYGHMEPVDWYIGKISFAFSNMEYVFENWGTWVYATEEEARLRNEEVKDRNKTRMLEKGYVFREDGSYSLFGDWGDESEEI